ncbi:DUF4350 domain-containing protein [Stenotrophomonas tumulicola]|uniref:DUF4350 domain-containing protein n=1 Tax=Stenotrophomonas tumulicola TaxID=1685415 RepID=A0A7W3FN18_9GAMM|nr:DUF4350 domain-containing protein [Stenotrophomonas tumulicola]MBA8682212.1 DUF4350 domain-containing protein [Stenotrophomonas tumulicola]
MKPRVLWSLLAGLALLVAVPLVVVFLRTHERVTQREVLPPQGEASYNPLYVLGLALHADGLQARSRARLDMAAMAPAPGDTLVLLQDSGELPPAQVDALLAWTARGGHLLLRTPPPVKGEDDDEPEPLLLQRLGVDSRGFPTACQRFHVEDDPSHVEFCGGRRFDLDDAAYEQVQREWGGEEGLVFARLHHGQGVVDVLADMEFMKGQPESHTFLPRALRPKRDVAEPRDGLHDRAHRDLTRYLLQPNYGKGTVWLVYASRPPSLWARIIFEGWPLWVPLLLALLGGLWARSQRFGSVLPSSPAERRSLLEHVRASGELLLRQRQGPRLHAAMRALFLRRLQARAPTAAALEGAAQEQAIADLLQWPPGRVQTALATPPANDSAALKERIALLLQMRSLL